MSLRASGINFGQNKREHSSHPVSVLVDVLLDGPYCRNGTNDEDK